MIFGREKSEMKTLNAHVDFQIHMSLLRNQEVKLQVMVTMSNFLEKTREKDRKETNQKNNPELLSRIKKRQKRN